MNHLQELLTDISPNTMLKINGVIYDYVDCGIRNGEPYLEMYRFQNRNYIRVFRWGKKTQSYTEPDKESYIAIDSITEISFIEKC